MSAQKNFENQKLDKNDHKVMPKVVSVGKKVLGVGGTILGIGLTVLLKTDHNPFKKS